MAAGAGRVYAFFTKLERLLELAQLEQSGGAASWGKVRHQDGAGGAASWGKVRHRDGAGGSAPGGKVRHQDGAGGAASWG